MKRFNVVVLHRGCGKSILAVNELIKRAFTCEDKSGAQFIYVAPEKQQAKNIIWAKLKYYTQNIPGLRIREDELTVTFPDNGAIICLEGADNPDRLRGRHPHFVVLDEVGQMKRDVWYEVVMPGTMSNRADVLFIGTPKGDNLFKELYDIASSLQGEGDEDWWACNYNVYNSGRYTDEEIKVIRKSMNEAKFNQEYLCSFDAAFGGSYYSELLLDENRKVLGDVPYDPTLPVITAWDLGLSDSTVIWFAQVKNEVLRVIDYYENSEKDFHHYLRVLKSKPYLYGYHIFPHDSVNRNQMTLQSRYNIAKQHGLRVMLAPKMDVKEGIAAVQNKLYTCTFDIVKCGKGIRALQQYRSKKDKLTGLNTDEPIHSDPADAFRYLVLGLKDPQRLDVQFENNVGQGKLAEAMWQYDYFG